MTSSTTTPAQSLVRDLPSTGLSLEDLESGLAQLEARWAFRTPIPRYREVLDPPDRDRRPRAVPGHARSDDPAGRWGARPACRVAVGSSQSDRQDRRPAGIPGAPVNDPRHRRPTSASLHTCLS